MILSVVLLILLLKTSEGVTSDTKSQYFAAATTKAGTMHTELTYCITDNFFPVFDDVFSDVSNNSVINITRDVALSSNVLLEGFENVTIIGQGNPTVNCNGIGSVKFVSCNDVTIEGVSWERCGSINLPGIELYNSFNITIQNCSFHHSIRQAVVLSKVSGNVYINNCQFTQNNYYEGHGAVLYYSKGNEDYQLRLIICNCNFSDNSAASSLVYFSSSINESKDCLSIQNSVFSYNQAVPVYISHNTLHLKGDVLFEHNVGHDGGAIFSSISLVTFEDNSNIRS